MTENDSAGEIFWRLIDPIWDEVSFYETWDILQRDFAKITEKQKNLYAAYWADYEICNGGFEQFFSNSTGMLGPEAVVGYRAIGMIDSAELVQEACLLLGIPFPRERADRQERLERLLTNHPKGRDVFNSIEQRFFKNRKEEAGGFEAAADRYACAD